MQQSDLSNITNMFTYGPVVCTMKLTYLSHHKPQDCHTEMSDNEIHDQFAAALDLQSSAGFQM